MVAIGHELVARAPVAAASPNAYFAAPVLDERAPELSQPESVTVNALHERADEGLVTELVNKLADAVGPNGLNIKLLQEILEKLGDGTEDLGLKKRADEGLVTDLINKLADAVGPNGLNIKLLQEILEKLGDGTEDLGLKKREEQTSSLPEVTSTVESTGTAAATAASSTSVAAVPTSQAANGTATSTPSGIEQGAGVSVRAPKVLVGLAAGMVAAFGVSAF
ncbi:hypothetical protein TRICI_001804 [Trichomonascus ciferrii]|uniref:Uncharacterized protein n=1 Tax=Trichomonascus ciferrii TaxID=44093 RepID=A0A642V8F3_9ASCO|nr:hypothetical protein TRICI_001804 [Trichomonascus ciferrii]